jgi:demethylmenaquinone methyltransferase/2-methoxy-6-polyprenyl-1,4-benzoquinol methylase
MSDTLKDYYRRRAASYEAIYHRADPVRLMEQEELARAIRQHLANRNVLEIATGTGWWTVQAASVARHVLATDANPETLDIARLKPFDSAKVEFQVADAFDLGRLGQRFDGLLSCCWLSHVGRADLHHFIAGMQGVLEPGAAVFIADNCLVPGQGGELVRSDHDADTYKRRVLEDREEQLVLKNYYDRDELRDLFASHATDLAIHHGQHFWWLSYRLKS